MRPGLAIHRNTAALLPAQLWDADKKTGKVRTLRDSLKDYKAARLHPEWARM
jgi:hypothetical protein